MGVHISKTDKRGLVVLKVGQKGGWGKQSEHGQVHKQNRKMKNEMECNARSCGTFLGRSLHHLSAKRQNNTMANQNTPPTRLQPWSCIRMRLQSLKPDSNMPSSPSHNFLICPPN